jgi:hypothetical protein
MRKIFCIGESWMVAIFEFDTTVFGCHSCSWSTLPFRDMFSLHGLCENPDLYKTNFNFKI